MTREKMTTAIADVVKSLNYTLYTGMEYRINDYVKLFPAAWLNPAKLIQMNGRERGTMRYAITIHLMTSGKHLSEKNKIGAWDKMESDAIELYHQLTMHGKVTAVDALQCTPNELTLSNHGELSLTMNFNLEIPFCA